MANDQFGKEGLGEISAVRHRFTSPKKSPLVPLWQRGKLLLTRLLSQLRYGLFKGEKVFLIHHQENLGSSL